MRCGNVLKTTKYVLFYTFQFEKNVFLPNFIKDLIVIILIFIVLNQKSKNIRI